MEQCTLSQDVLGKGADITGIKKSISVQFAAGRGRKQKTATYNFLIFWCGAFSTFVRLFLFGKTDLLWPCFAAREAFKKAKKAHRTGLWGLWDIGKTQQRYWVLHCHYALVYMQCRVICIRLVVVLKAGKFLEFHGSRVSATMRYTAKWFKLGACTALLCLPTKIGRNVGSLEL